MSTNILQTVWRDRTARFGIIILCAAALVGLLAEWISPFDPIAQSDVLRTRFLAPFQTGPDGAFHLLGTDRFGRDMLSRMIHGARVSLSVGVLSVTLAVGLGLTVGVSAAVLGSRWDRGLMAITNAALAMPRLVLLLALVAVFEPSLTLVILVLGFTGWMTIARLARAECLRVMALDFVKAADASGTTRPGTIARHLLPNIMTPIIISAALGLGHAITLESGLAFLGLGVPPPSPSWGNMIAGGRDALVNAPWIAGLPGLAIILVVVAANLTADALRDALDPHVRSGQTKTVTTDRGAATNATPPSATAMS
jgi:peptide/nickel transport system permease protein